MVEFAFASESHKLMQGCTFARAMWLGINYMTDHPEDGAMAGETFERTPRGNNYIVYRGDKTRDFDLKLQMKIKKGGGGGKIPVRDIWLCKFD